jgi:hypothetical protein
MTEKDIIELGFDRVDVTAGESGYPEDWHYYTYDLTNHLSLISCDNNEAKKSGWYVEIFDAGTDIRFTSHTQLLDLIYIIENAKIRN